VHRFVLAALAAVVPKAFWAASETRLSDCVMALAETCERRGACTDVYHVKAQIRDEKHTRGHGQWNNPSSQQLWAIFPFQYSICLSTGRLFNSSLFLSYRYIA